MDGRADPTLNAHGQRTMTISAPDMRSNRPVSMDIDQLRGWASFMDRAMVVSLVATLIAVAALGVTTFLSFRYGGAVRAHEQAALAHYKGLEGQAAQLEREASAARERAVALEREVSTSRERTAALQQDAAAVRERAAALEQELSSARARAEAFERAAREATERAAQAASDSAAASDKARAPVFDAAAIKQRVADLAKLVREAATRPADPAPPRAVEAPRPAGTEAMEQGPPETPAAPPSPFVASLRKFTGTKAAVFVVGQVSDAPAIGATISADLTAAGWAPQTWTWAGVAGLFGVTVLIRDGSDPATHEAASALVEALRGAGFNATKGDWPANWGRFRGVLNGPQVPGPTDAAIRIVVGAQAR